MKLNTALLLILTVFAMPTAFAAEEAATAKAETPAAGKSEANKPMKRHNHMEEKTGIPMPPPKAHSDAPADAPADKAPVKKHFHPTDR